MNKERTIASIMKKNIITLHPKETMQHAKALFQNHQIHHIPIVVMDKVIGIMSLGDVLFFERTQNANADKFLRSKNSYANIVEDIMTKNPICINSTIEVVQAIDLMQKYRVNCLPIVDDNKFVGLITTYDLMNCLKDEIAINRKLRACKGCKA